ncbi:MAG: hypothetical protein EPO68_04145 [Planctomycetota bacterium]|nr:MAG: hypothetical protein EPO68_04145 [Planctomycetota bacterium]
MTRPIRDAFESVLKDAGLTNICVGCGGLTPISPAVVVVNYPEQPTKCAECGLLLNEHRRPVGHRAEDGRVYVRVISLRSDYPADAAPIPVE